MKLPPFRLSWFQPRETLTDDQKFRRGEYAKRLLADEALNEALDAMAEDAFNAVLRIDHSEASDRDRAVAIERVRLVKDFREQLSTFVRLGEGTVAKRG